MTEHDWFFPRGSLAEGGWESVVGRGIAGWQHTGLRVADLGPGDALELAGDDVERIVIPLTGPALVEFTPPGGSPQSQELSGRGSVFEGPTDVLYLGAGTSLRLAGAGRVAIAEAPDAEPRPWRYIPREEVPVELRGRGRNSRQVHNFGIPSTLNASRFMVVEVLTPSMNWSSFPPHKHDRNVPGQEAALEEVYYFESEPLVAPEAEADPIGLMRTYASDGERPIHLMREVRTGDIVLVPHGYHGPTAATPGYNLYMLNVMAGPAGKREWLLHEDPAHHWIVDTFADEPVDERLPFGS